MTSLVLTSFNKKPFNKDLFDGLVSFNYLLTQKLPRKAKVALVADRCSQRYKKVAENAKSCSKVAEHNLFMPSQRAPMGRWFTLH